MRRFKSLLLEAAVKEGKEAECQFHLVTRLDYSLSYKLLVRISSLPEVAAQLAVSINLPQLINIQAVKCGGDRSSCV